MISICLILFFHEVFSLLFSGLSERDIEDGGTCDFVFGCVEMAFQVFV